MEIREFEIREVNQEERTVAGVAVPFNQTIEVGGFRESFARGAFDDNVTATLFYGHDHRSGGLPIGKVIEARNGDDGYEVKARLSETAKGNEVYQLLKDGVLNRFSVGFEPVENEVKDDVVIRTKATLKEVSIVPMPAYTGAVIAEVRDNSNEIKENEMTEVNYSDEVADLRSAVTDLERKFAVMGDSKTETVSDQFRTGGEALKALVSGEDSAKTQFRAFTGATTVDTNVQPAWINRLVRLVDENRDVLNAFSKAPHPGSTSVTLPVLGTTTGTVGVQVAEGDDLPYLEVTFADKTFSNVTYGGYSSLSRQAIELGTPNYLNKVLEFQALQYAKATNTAVRNVLLGATGTPTATLAADSFAGWTGLVIDAASTLESNGSGVAAEFALVSTDVFRRLATLADSAGRPLMVVNNDGVNTVGAANVKGLRGNILGLEVRVDGAAPANTCIITNSEAITVMESAGAPVRLQDENIINLTKDFSLYGYMIAGVTNELAIVKVDADLVV